MIRVDRADFSSDGSDTGLGLSDEPRHFGKRNGRAKFAVSQEQRPRSTPRQSLADLIRSRSDMLSDGPSAVVGQSIRGVRNTDNGRASATSYKHFTTPPAPAASQQNRDLNETLNRLSQENLDLRAEVKVLKNHSLEIERELSYASERKAHYKAAAIEAHENAQNACQVTSTQKAYIENLEQQAKVYATTELELKQQVEILDGKVLALQKQIAGLERQAEIGQGLEEELRKRAELAEKRVEELEKQIAFMEKVYASKPDSAGTETSEEAGAQEASDNKRAKELERQIAFLEKLLFLSRSGSSGSERPVSTASQPSGQETTLQGSVSSELDADIASKKADLAQAEQDLKHVTKRLEKKSSKLRALSLEYDQLREARNARAQSSEPAQMIDKSTSPVTEAQRTRKPMDIPLESVSTPVSTPLPAPTPVFAPAAPSQEYLDMIRYEMSSLKQFIGQALESKQAPPDISSDIRDALLQLSKAMVELKSQNEQKTSPTSQAQAAELPFESRKVPEAARVETPRRAASTRSIPRMQSVQSLQGDAFVAESSVPGLSDDSTAETMVGDQGVPLYNEQLMAEAKRQLVEMDHPHRADVLRFIGNQLNNTRV